jgi:hypothetical protein
VVQTYGVRTCVCTLVLLPQSSISCQGSYLALHGALLEPRTSVYVFNVRSQHHSSCEFLVLLHQSLFFPLISQAVKREQIAPVWSQYLTIGTVCLFNTTNSSASLCLLLTARGETVTGSTWMDSGSTWVSLIDYMKEYVILFISSHRLTLSHSRLEKCSIPQSLNSHWS